MKNWPQIPVSIAEIEYQRILDSPDTPKPCNRHPDQTYSPVGARIDDASVQRLIDQMTELAISHGYPSQVSPDDRVRFDRRAATVLRDHMTVTWAEAGSARLWSFLSLVALPHLTQWRFGNENRERWIATDLTRHTWARLWWQAVIFQNHQELLNRLKESELNQLLERRSIGGDSRLVAIFANAVLNNGAKVNRRRLIRDATKRLRRILAFVDPLALNDAQLEHLCASVVTDSVAQIDQSETNAAPA